jgi:uncharacterized protein (UPF0332 family)
MNDQEALFTYRWNQAEETLAEARKMLEGGFSGRTIVNRAYYALFYALLALYLKLGIEINTSKHTGIISLFDKVCVQSGKVPKKYSAILHDVFDARLESDYKELSNITLQAAALHVDKAAEFMTEIKKWF